MCDEITAFMIEDGEHEVSPSNDVDSMAKIAWAAAVTGEIGDDCSWYALV